MPGSRSETNSPSVQAGPEPPERSRSDDQCHTPCERRGDVITGVGETLIAHLALRIIRGWRWRVAVSGCRIREHRACGGVVGELNRYSRFPGPAKLGRVVTGDVLAIIQHVSRPLLGRANLGTRPQRCACQRVVTRQRHAVAAVADGDRQGARIGDHEALRRAQLPIDVRQRVDTRGANIFNGEETGLVREDVFPSLLHTVGDGVATLCRHRDDHQANTVDPLVIHLVRNLGGVVRDGVAVLRHTTHILERGRIEITCVLVATSGGDASQNHGYGFGRSVSRHAFPCREQRVASPSEHEGGSAGASGASCRDELGIGQRARERSFGDITGGIRLHDGCRCNGCLGAVTLQLHGSFGVPRGAALEIVLQRHGCRGGSARNCRLGEAERPSRGERWQTVIGVMLYPLVEPHLHGLTVDQRPCGRPGDRLEVNLTEATEVADRDRPGNRVGVVDHTLLRADDGHLRACTVTLQTFNSGVALHDMPIGEGADGILPRAVAGGRAGQRALPGDGCLSAGHSAGLCLPVVPGAAVPAILE